MELTSVVLQVAGFVLAHGADSVANLTKQEVLVPFGMSVNGGEQKKLNFNAATPEESLKLAQDKLHEQKAFVDTCAIMYETVKDVGGDKAYAFNIEAWEKEIDVELKIVQPFEPSGGGKGIKIIGDPLLFVDGMVVTDEKAIPLLGFVYSGLAQHPGGKLWDQLKGG